MNLSELSPYARNFTPVNVEANHDALPVTGSLPRGLEGTLWRNGPNPLFPRAEDHWFTGDGMLHAFVFRNGRVSYRNRWLRTRRWQAEQAARGPMAMSPCAIEDDDGVGNTNIVSHAGRLLVLEEGHLPLLLDGFELRSALPIDFGGALAGPFTAHPKLDPDSGELVFFGYGSPEWMSPGMSYGTIDHAGRVTRFEHFEHFEAPYASMVHDFAMTRHHVLFPVMPIVADRARAAAGGPPFAWEPDRGTFVGLMRRDASVSTIEWRKGPAGYFYHVMNAWEEGSRLHLDVMHSAVPALFTRPDGSSVKGNKDACLSRWSFDLAAPGAAAKQEWLCDIPGELPRIDERYTGRRNRHGWFVGDCRSGQPFGRLVQIDHEEGRLDTWDLSAEDCASEAVFVPRDTAEGDGWLLCVVYRGREERSDLLVMDALRLSAGPVATVHLPCRVPNGFHGNWIAA